MEKYKKLLELKERVVAYELENKNIMKRNQEKEIQL
jgi:hypothetical protein